MNRVRNSDIADIFNTVANLLEIEGANTFRIQAYRNAARTVGNFPHNVSDMVTERRDVAEIPGIGKDLARKIHEIVKTGTLSQLRELKARTPMGLVALTRVPGLGPKRARTLYNELGVDSLTNLRQAAEAGKIRTITGFGPKTEQMILEEVERLEQRTRRTPYIEAERSLQTLLPYLEASKGVRQLTVAGSYRRRLETVGDIDIVVACDKGSDIMQRFTEYQGVVDVISKGPTRSTVLLFSGLQVDIRVVPPESYGAALLYFTGSKAHNITLRRMAIQRGYKNNEYGIYEDDRQIAGKTEEEMYAQLDLPYIEPELRENRGEIEAAAKNNLPKLITLNEIRGDLHAHTSASDGKNTLQEMAEAAQARGYEYLAITDHSKRLTIAHGLDSRRLRLQMQQIDLLNKQFKKFRLLKGAEVDILEDGTLDLPDDVLKELDVVIGSVHHLFHLPREKQTERVLRALDNRYVQILAHPTGRLIPRRDPFEIDMERIIRAAKERGCILEINAWPERLDLNDIHARLAKDTGVKMAISTDAHRPSDLDYMRYGIAQARRGWLESRDVVNTRSLTQLSKMLKRT